MKLGFKNKFIRIGVLSLGIILGLSFSLIRLDSNQSTVQAVGDLEVNWGVPDGQPIFVVTNMMPGEVENRNVIVTNNASSLRSVGVRGIETGGTTLKDVLEIVISQSGTDLYGGATGTKTLTQFFADSGGPDGIPLSDLAAGTITTYNFEVTFPQTAGNEFQGTSVIFDLRIGISIELPAECEAIDLLPTPIIGTSKADTLTGTPGNDLILGLEGADIINGNSGDDCILGGSGADTINGNDGNDVIFGEEGADTINGNNGNDFISGGKGADTLRGQNGDDHLIGNEAADTLDGGNGDDILEGSEGADTLRGGNGNDVLIGGAGVDYANGNAGTDTCDAETEINCEI
jgi:Ca2+-binding RTX toxin-like protein